MNTQRRYANQWVKFGASCGIIANLLFPVLIFVPLPDYLMLFFTAMFGITYALLGFGIHHFLKESKPTIYTQVAAIFILISGFLFNVMLMIQLTFKGYIESFEEQASPSDLELLNWISKTVNPIHLGLQFSNDFFTACAMVLLSLVMFRHPHFGKIWSAMGYTIATALIIIKCYSFPFTPGEVGIPYLLGPFISLWFFAICIQCLRKRNQVFELS